MIGFTDKVISIAKKDKKYLIKIDINGKFLGRSRMEVSGAISDKNASYLIKLITQMIKGGDI